jgi:PPOX class probable F420-dependent enzyme
MMTGVPDSHVDLLTAPIHGVLTTMTSDGHPHSSIVWVGYDGEHVLITTTLERFKGRNMLDDPKTTLLIVDPEDGDRFIEIRGSVVDYLTDEGDEFVDRQTWAYTGGKLRRFYGDIYPESQRARETRVTFRIAVTKANTDAVFK